MTKLLRLLGFIWALPATIPTWLFYILPAWALGWIRLDGSADFLVAQFSVNDETVKNWYTRFWKDWGGFGGPCVVILKDDPKDSSRYARTLLHERRHAFQILCLGIFQPVIYILISGALWVSAKVGISPDTHPYLDNPFERDARKAAGQMVDIPREMWRRGPSDHWPWW
jgi:hypothetical protein